MNKIFRIIIHFVIVIFAIIVLYNAYSYYLDCRIAELYSQHMTTINHTHGCDIKDKGNVLIEKSMTESNMVIMGSSELSSDVPENPKNFFPNNIYGSDASFVGHAYVQNALHAMNIGSNDKSFNGKDVVIIESLQWFTGNDIDTKGFFANFSEIQFYEFLNNRRISRKNKEYLCNRYIQLENKSQTNVYDEIDRLKEGYNKLQTFDSIFVDNIQKTGYEMINTDYYYSQTYYLAKMYVSDRLLDRAAYYISTPYYWLRYKVLSLKDKYDCYMWLKSLGEPEGVLNKDISWDDIYYEAEIEGKELCTNNVYNVKDDYYVGYIKDHLEESKNSAIDTIMFESQEWKDYEFFLDVCKDLDVHPYIISMSTNGLWYDYTGVKKENRDKLYNNIESMANDYGYDCLNLENYEYEPYFYCDVMHLGWKGWAYVTQSIIEHYAQ